MEKLKVGYLINSYPYKRNIIDIVNDVDYIHVSDIYKLARIPLKILCKLKLYNKEKLSNNLFTFNDFNLNRVDLLHFFNTVSYGRTPWISTFETFIPRYSGLMNHQKNGIMGNDNNVHKALSAISSNSCKKIIALSECTLNFQKQLLNKYPQYKDNIQKKLCVLHPPQRLFINNIEEKGLSINDEISFIFIGRTFFGKGGLEVLKVFEKLRNKSNLPIRLTLVSSLAINDHSSRAGERELNIAKKIIYENKSWIKYFYELPNDEVLKLMRKHHVGLLPTWADTYGYSVLEMQANGCPVISTDVRALPEINNDEKGWLINASKNELGEAFYSTLEEREILSKSIAGQLEEIVLEIFNDRHSINQKAQQSINYIRENHSMQKYALKLMGIYSECV